MKRFHQVLLIGSFLPLCWLGMMAVHELGHVLAALATGGMIERVVLHPLTISRTDVSPNPAPLTVVWAGPLIGALVPVAVWLATRANKSRWGYMVRFFAGFCLVANGGYVGGGSLGGDRSLSDPGVMLGQGSPRWSLWLFAAICFPLGLYLWNGLGPRFGLGAARGNVDRRAAYASCGLLVLTVIVEMVLSPR